MGGGGLKVWGLGMVGRMSWWVVGVCCCDWWHREVRRCAVRLGTNLLFTQLLDPTVQLWYVSYLLVPCENAPFRLSFLYISTGTGNSMRLESALARIDTRITSLCSTLY